MKWNYDTRYPSIEDLRNKARRRVPRFAWEYLEGGCNEEVNLHKNTLELRQIELKPYYIRERNQPDLRTELFGENYEAPFGVAPIGLQGLIWPGSPDYLAAAAKTHNLPFIISTVTTASIEKIASVTEGKAWFQLYHPAEEAVRNDMLKRAEEAGLRVLVILADVPSFGFRPWDIKNGLAMPPSMKIKNILQVLAKPRWAWATLQKGQPAFETMKPYMPKGMDMKQLGQFMNRTFSGWLNEERVAAIRDRWKGKLVIKGIATAEDAAAAIRLGADGIIVSNHGGRQLDAGESAIHSLSAIAGQYKNKITVMMDSGLRSGPDIARAVAAGAQFCFLGRSFMYGVAALGERGASHTMAVLKTQLQQVLEQLNCAAIKDLPAYRVQ